MTIWRLVNQREQEVVGVTITFTDPQINYYVEDVEVAERFYTEHFGFVETFRTPEP